jgi:hypothetical protein
VPRRQQENSGEEKKRKSRSLTAVREARPGLGFFGPFVPSPKWAGLTCDAAPPLGKEDGDIKSPLQDRAPSSLAVTSRNNSRFEVFIQL